MHNLANTKWIAESWTIEMRAKWIDRMMSVGFKNLIPLSDGNCYSYVVGEQTIGGRTKDSYDHSECKPMQYADAFPELSCDNFEEEFDAKLKEQLYNSSAEAFNTITGKDITPKDVALIMQLTKAVCQWSQGSLYEDVSNE